MKLSAKILGIVGILGLLALSVMGLGLYGMSRLGAAIDNYMRIADRSEALMAIEADALQFSISEKNVLLAKDDATMREILESDDFKNALPNFLKGIEQIKQSITPTSQAWVLEVPEKLTRAASAFIEATDAVAQITQENTAQKALDEYHASLPFWDEYLTVANAVFTGTANNWETYGNNAEEVFYMYDLRVNRVSFQRDIQLVMTARAEGERQAAVESLRAGITEFLASLEKAPQVFGNGLNSQFGLDLAGQLDNARKIQVSAEKIIALAGQDSDGRAFAYSTSVVRESREAFNAILHDAVDKSHTQLNGLAAENHALQERLFWVMLVGSIAGIVLVVCIAGFIVARLTRQLHQIIEGLNNASMQVAAAADSISESSQSLAEGVSEQAASLEETSAALEEMASMTRRNADNATQTHQTTSHTVQLIDQGAKGVVKMSQAMGEITDSAEQISRIIKTIEGIAFQTNLLALNAAVEAARAGEAGMGFAVVADEVRNLAQGSAQAAHDTAELIEGTVTRVKNGANIATELDAEFKAIDEGAQNVGKLIGAISTATSEQAQGVDQVNTAVVQMDKVTQSNAAAAEECASAAEELLGQAESLKGMVGHLMALVTGASQPPAGGTGRPPAAGGSRAGHEARRLAGPASARRGTTKSEAMIPMEEGFGDF